MKLDLWRVGMVYGAGLITGILIQLVVPLFPIGTSIGVQQNCNTNIVDNGLSSWLADTNHTFGSTMASRIFILQHPDGKFYLRFKEPTNEVFWPLFVADQPYDSAESARQALSLNLELQIRKSISDTLENALRRL